MHILFIKHILPSCSRAWLLSACAKQMWSRSSCHGRTFMPSSTPEWKEMAAATGSQRMVDDHVLNQAKQLRMSYTRKYKLHGSCESVPRDKSVPNRQMILCQHEDDWTLGSWCLVSNTRHHARFSRSRSSHLTVYFFILVSGPRPHGDRHSVVLALVTITMLVGVINTSKARILC